MPMMITAMKLTVTPVRADKSLVHIFLVTKKIFHSQLVLWWVPNGWIWALEGF